MYSVLTFDMNTGNIIGKRANTRDEARALKRVQKTTYPNCTTHIYPDLDQAPTVR